jgi:hypothetical protein
MALHDVGRRPAPGPPRPPRAAAVVNALAASSVARRDLGHEHQLVRTWRRCLTKVLRGHPCHTMLVAMLGAFAILVA